MKFTDFNIVSISNLVKDQFPAFYKEDGPNFIAFLEAYYEWMAQEDNPIYNQRTLYDAFDIDTAAEKFLQNYKAKYMYGLPPELLGNQRLLQKHIIEIYRSKGSQQAIRLLFRLLYNEEIDFYIPSYDIFKLSDNTWKQPRYIEVTGSHLINEYINKIITGSNSSATAVVESVEKRYVNGNVTYNVFISNQIGEFQTGEKIITEGISVIDAPVILGSVVGLNITGSAPGAEVGERFIGIQGEEPVSVIVSEVYDGTGSIQFTVLDGGSYYTLDAEVFITAGANTTGAGADFRVQTLRDTFQIQYNTDKILPYANIALNAAEYGFPALPEANISSIIADCLQHITLTVGTIDTLLVLNPGTGYDGNVTVRVTDPYTSTSGIFDANGNVLGNNAVISGEPIVGDNIIGAVRVEDSGYNIRDLNLLSFISQSNTELTLTGQPIIGGVGWGIGYYDNTKSFLSDDKYLFDGHYYQDFSYVIRAARTLDKYIEILRKLAHPAGNAVYGDIKITREEQYVNDAIATIVKVTEI